MKISDIVQLLTRHELLVDFSAEGAGELEIKSVSYNSNDIGEQCLFICKGFTFKAEYLQAAIASGIAAYMSEEAYPVDPAVPHILVSDIRKALSLVSILYYNNPYKSLDIVGITGTKGKTTTAYFVKNIIDEHIGGQSAILSSVEVFTGKESVEAHLTTPESLELQGYFNDARQNGQKFLTMEVSSQAYKLQRVFGMHFKVGVFLNIGEDHIGPLEHEDLEDYLTCKLQLMQNCDIAVINSGTDFYDRVRQAARAGARKAVTYGTDPESDYYYENVVKRDGKLFFDVHSGRYKKTFAIAMEGRFNVENAVAAVTVAKSLFIDDEDIARGLLNTAVAGRMNVYEKNGVTVIVDYAHNFLSFSKLYESLKQDYPGRRIVTLYGCPGGKALLRRRDISILSGKNAGYIYLTAEDPQYEKVSDICKDIAGYLAPFGVPYEIIEDRTQAIEKAIGAAEEGDVIILAGKGEELYQKVNGNYEPYESDVVIAKRCLGIS